MHRAAFVARALTASAAVGLGDPPTTPPREHSHGATDDFGYTAAEQKAIIYDLHATVLHLLDLDHERLSFYHNGIERRLTDVHGEVIESILS
jgi:hypothetical protein